MTENDTQIPSAMRIQVPENKKPSKEKPFESARTSRSKFNPDLVFDYKDTETLKRFLTETGALVPRRVNKLTAKQQRALTRAVKQARHLALLPYAIKEPGGMKYA